MRHSLFKDLRDYEMGQFTAGPSGFARSISRSNLAENLSQYSRRNSDNASDPGSSSANIAVTQNGGSIGPTTKVNMNNSISGVGGNGSFYKQKPTGFGSNKKVDKKKVLPVTKKFPELKLMINGEQRNHNNSMSSDDDNLAVSELSDRYETMAVRLVSLSCENLVCNGHLAGVVPSYKEVLAAAEAVAAEPSA